MPPSSQSSQSGNGTFSTTLALFSLRRPWFANLSAESAKADLLAGLTNAAIVLPQGVAFAIIAGLPPEMGLYTAMITVVVAAFWGSSMIMVSGPTTAISAILFATLSELAPPGTPDYVSLALTMTVLVGLLQLVAGVARLGALISFISHSVIVGFTAAAAILIAVSQLGSAMGLSLEQGGSILERLARVAAEADETLWSAVAVALVTLATIVLFQRIDRRIPAYLIALVAGSAFALLIGASDRGVATFSALPSVLPSPTLPLAPLGDVVGLFQGALSIAFIGLLEAISIGRAFAVRRGERYNSNQEIVGQGLSNIVGGFFQAYAGSGSFTRSGLNAECGAKTPLAAILAAVWLLAMLLILAPLVVYIPVPAMAGLILYVAWRLIDFSEIRHIMHSRSETWILLATFLAGVLLDLEFAIVTGVIMSLIFFLYESAHPFVGVGAPTIENGRRVFRNAERLNLPQCPRISGLRIEGPLFFASIEKVEARFRQIEADNPGQNIKILGLRSVGKIDLAGADFLVNEIKRARRQGGDFYIIAARPETVGRLERLGVLKELGEDHLFKNKEPAIAAAVRKVDPEVCAGCKARVFLECASKPGAHSV